MKPASEQIANLSPEKIRQLAKALRDKKNSTAPQPVLKRHHGRTEYPLSFGQERLWFLDQLAPGNAAYNWPFATRVNIDFDPEVYRRTMFEMARRHEILRTVYVPSGDTVVQKILPASELQITVVDLRNVEASAQEQEALRRMRKDASAPFDLAKGPLCRFQLFHLGPADWIVSGTMHHSIVDAWSRKVFMEEGNAIYAALATNKPPQTPEPTFQYGDYSVWQRQWYEQPERKNLRDYWIRQLKDLRRLEIPADFPRPAFPTFAGTTQLLAITRALNESLRAIGQREGATPFMTLFAGFLAVLTACTGETDIAGAIPVANRTATGIENLIGFFVNTLVLRVDLSGNPSFREVIRRVRRVAIDAFAHQEMPFERLVDELQPKRDISRNPLASFIFQLEDIPKTGLTANANSSSASNTSIDIDSGTSVFDMSIHLYENWDTSIIKRDEAIRGTLTYNADVFHPETMRRLVRHYLHALTVLADKPDTPLGELALLSRDDEQVLQPMNALGISGHIEQTAVGLFEFHAAKTPDAVAVVCGNSKLSYAELNRGANRLSRLLKQLGAGPERIIGICLHRSIETVTALLAVLKAGSAYLPLEPGYPTDRIRLMLENAGAKFIIVNAPDAGKIDPAFTSRIICLDRDASLIAEQNDDNLRCDIAPRNLAYVLYTSGSTGKPKGVAVEHRQLSNYIQSISAKLALREGMTFAYVSTFAADLGNTVLFPSLCGGGTLVLVSEEEAASGPELSVCLERNRVDIYKIAPPHFSALAANEAYAGLLPADILVFGGDSLSAASVDALRRTKPGLRLFNHYGPAECTVGCLSCEITPATPPTSTGTIPLGNALANMQIYLLDSSLRPVPDGVPGEIFISGAGVSRGYLNEAAATAERFLPDLFSPIPALRMYRTGDRGRRLADGSIEFLGRQDHQVKIRGYRVELGEVEAVLREHPSVREAAVVTYEKHEGRRLACLLVRSPQPRFSPSAYHEERLEEWRAIYDDLYAQAEPSVDSGITTIGWNSSYTGQPIAECEMQEAVESTVRRILSLRPRRVLEIGCGSGLLLFRLAPHCRQYTATDISSSAVRYVEAQTRNLTLENITLLNRPADDFSGFPPRSFDLVLLNSVIQYFPGVSYLMRVLEQAASLLAPGGSIFVGDVRNLHLMEVFHAAVEIHRAPVSMPIEKLLRRIRRRIADEDECVVAPEFFHALPANIPALKNVDIQLKRGRLMNELTKFRYDAVLHSSSQTNNPHIAPCDWGECGLTLSALVSRLSRDRPECLAVSGIPNARLWSDYEAMEVLRQDPALRLLQQAKQLLDQKNSSTVDPEDLWRLADSLGYSAAVSWSRNLNPKTMDAIFTDTRRHGRTIYANIQPRVDQRCELYVNNPLKRSEDRQLVHSLRNYLSQQLPEYMVPNSWSILEQMPLNANGKLDRVALQEYISEETGPSNGLINPRDPVEMLLIQVIEELLDIRPIGVNENFFDLGGDSILAIQLVGRARAAGLFLTPRDVFENQTAESLAAVSQICSQAPRPRDAVFGELPATPTIHVLLEHEASITTASESVVWRIPRTWNPTYLPQVVQSLLDCHHALRMQLVREPDGKSCRLIIARQGTVSAGNCLRFASIRTLARERREAYIAEETEAARARLDPERGSILQLVWFESAPDMEPLLLIVVHRLAIDGVSWSILAQDLATIWASIQSGEQPALKPENTSFREWALFLTAQAKETAIIGDFPYWAATLTGCNKICTEALDPCRDLVETSARLAMELPPPLAAALLLRTPSALGGSVDEALLTALVLALHQWRGKERRGSDDGFIIDLTVTGREGLTSDADFSRTVGSFETAFPMLLNAGGLDLDAVWLNGTGLRPLFDSIRDQLRAAPHGGLSFGILRYLNPSTASDLTALPVPEIGFTHRMRTHTVNEQELSHEASHISKAAHPKTLLSHVLEIDVTTAAEHGKGPSFVAHWCWAPTLLSETRVRALAETWFRALATVVDAASTLTNEAAPTLLTKAEAAGAKDIFELRVMQICKDILGRPSMAVTDDFFAAGGTYLSAARLLARTRNSFSHNLQLSALPGKASIEKLAAELRRSRKLQVDTPITFLRESGNKEPLFLIHPAGGGVMCYYELAHSFDPERAVIGLAYQGFENCSESFPRVEDMAAHYLDKVRALWPNGPYLFGGWSLGGFIAFEMARQLEEQASAPATVFILDQPAPTARRAETDEENSSTSALISMMSKWEIFSGVHLDITEESLRGLDERERLELVLTRLKSLRLLPANADVAAVQHFLTTYTQNVRASRAYHPGSYSGELILLRATESVPGIDRNPEQFSDPAMGWTPYCGSIRVHSVPGNHLSIITAPNVKVLGRVMIDSLAQRPEESPDFSGESAIELRYAAV